MQVYFFYYIIIRRTKWKNLWDKDERRIYRKLFKEYKREGCSNEEARMYAKQDCRNSIGLDIDSAERLYKDILKDFDIMTSLL